MSLEDLSQILDQRYRGGCVVGILRKQKASTEGVILAGSLIMARSAITLPAFVSRARRRTASKG
jgi:hypothetical protein